VWEALTKRPGTTSADLAGRLATDAFYTDVLCPTAFSFGLLARDGEGWRMAPHGEVFMREVAEALKTLPRIFLDLILPRLPGLLERLQGGARLLDVGCGAGWAVAQLAGRFPETTCVGIDLEPYSVERALKPGGYFLSFDEAYPETDVAMQTMPTRFAALAQWYELTWGNVVDSATTLRARCQEAGLEVAEETSFSRFSILVATKP
jgi:Putative methyltransferase